MFETLDILEIFQILEMFEILEMCLILKMFHVKHFRRYISNNKK